VSDEQRPPLLYVLAATLGLIGVPVLAAATLTLALRPRPGLAIVLGVSLGIALAVSVVGQAMWSRRPESARFALGDLMVWNALRRHTATRRVEQQTHMLGFDLEGRYAGHDRVPLDQQLAIAREISHALEMKSAYSRNHSRRVERHVRRMAAVMGMAHDDTEQLAVAAELHDIGNIQIPEHLLSKPGILTQIEREAIEGHVALGAAMAFTAGSTEVVEGIRHHHERWDGSGYPNGLVGEEIPLFARMIAIAEVYDAMTSPRPYRRSFSREQALQLIKDQAGVHFDPDLVDVFVDSVREQNAAAFAPLIAFPLQLTRDFFASVRRMGNGSVAAVVGGGTALILLGTAIIAPGTFDLPSEFTPPDVVSAAASPITVNIDNPDPDEETALNAEPEEADGSLDTVADVVLGTRFQNDPPVPTVVPDPDPTTPTPSDGPPTDGPPTDSPPIDTPPIVTPPDLGGPLPGVGGPTPNPGPTIPDGRGHKDKKPKKDKGSKDKNPNANGNGHAYGHDKGNDHPGNAVPPASAPGHDEDRDHPGNAYGHDKDKGKDKDKGGNHGVAPVPGITPAAAPEEVLVPEDDGGDG
jgi:HD-GYP domain-containing protein (c-di-GMP phosphodiesterase class II)